MTTYAIYEYFTHPTEACKSTARHVITFKRKKIAEVVLFLFLRFGDKPNCKWGIDVHHA